MAEILCYVTAKTKEEAEAIAEYLLEKRIIAGANLFPVESRYRWQGEICRGTEYGIFMQSRQECFPEIEKAVKQLHSYEIPCILSFGIAEGNADFLSWIHINTQNKRG